MLSNSDPPSPKIACPCTYFQTEESVLLALRSEDETLRLSLWLRGRDVPVEGDAFVVSQQTSHCDDCINGRCPHRVGAAFVILNAVRDGCRRYLDSPTATLKSVAKPAATSKSKARALPSAGIPDRAEVKFESAFPSLQTLPATTTPNVLVGRKKKKQPTKPSQPDAHPHANNFPVPKSGVWSTAASDGTGISTKPEKPPTKRRIRPVQTASLSSSPWGSSSTSGLQQAPALKGNIASLPSEDPSLLRKPPVPPELPRKRVTNTPAIKTAVDQSIGGGDQAPESIACGVQSKSKTVETMAPVLDKAEASTTKADSEDHSQDIVKSIENMAVHDDSSTHGRVVDVYVEVVQNLLAPSVPLELHLLIRMVSVDASTIIPDRSELGAADGRSAGLKSIFSSGLSCRRFACEALSRLKSVVLNLGHEVISALVALPILADALPALLAELKAAIEASSDDQLLESSHMVGKDTLQLTVPFDENRDSRHNYRSRDQTLLFKNREESRDKFMYQLRAFQEIRTVVDPTQADLYIDEIKRSCQEMVIAVNPGNIFWFAEYFCDLILQIGLVPMEETDKEILKNVDKERLKKLHRRFTSKGSQKSKSSQKLSLDRKDQAVSTAQGLFSGHQEFFYIFLLAVDSYSFGVHLRRRIVGLLSDMSSAEEVKLMEDRVAKLQLLAKFLGMLTFSPNWSTVYEDPSSSTNLALSTASNDALAQLNCTVPMIPLRKYIEESWREGHLLIVIPWVVEFLRMATWDNLSIKARYYQDVLALLRSIHRRIGIGQGTHGGRSALRSNMLLVSFQLETLFAAVVGLSKCEKLPEITLPCQTEGTSWIDAVSVRFSRNFLFSASSHLDELHSLIIDLTHKKHSGTGAPKKLRPYAVSNVLFPSSPAPGNIDQGRRASRTTHEGSRLFSQNENDIRGKLVGTFFHQHRDLQELCEFIVRWSVKNTSSALANECIAPALDEQASSDGTDLKSFSSSIGLVEKQITLDAGQWMYLKTAESIRESMKTLCPPSISADVRDIATTLAIQNSQQNCDAIVSSMVRIEMKKRVDLFAKQMAKNAATKEAEQSQNNKPSSPHQTKRAEETSLQEQLESVSSALEHLVVASPEWLTDTTLEESRVVVFNTNSYVLAADENERPGSDRDQTTSVKRFGESQMSLMRFSFSELTFSEHCYQICSLVLVSFSLTISLRRSGFVVRELTENCIYLCEPALLEKVLVWSNSRDESRHGADEGENGSDPCSNEYALTLLEELVVILVDAVHVRLISASTLERSLIGVVERKSQGDLAIELSHLCLQRLCGEAQDNSSHAPFMPRLRKVVGESAAGVK